MQKIASIPATQAGAGVKHSTHPIWLLLPENDCWCAIWYVKGYMAEQNRARQLTTSHLLKISRQLHAPKQHAAA